jgi:hypothetical protein
MVRVTMIFRGQFEVLRCDPVMFRSWYSFSQWIADTYAGKARLTPDFSGADDSEEAWWQYTEQLRLDSLKVRPRPPRWWRWLTRRFRRAPLRVLP